MKRFTETAKWDDPWFRALKGVEKLVFLYVTDRCNNAGFWEVDEDAMAFQTKLSPAHISGAWQGLNRGLIRCDGWVWVRRFLRHQKNENLNPLNNAHIQIIALLKEQIDRFDNEPEFQQFLAPYEPLFRGPGIVKVKDKRKGSAEGKPKFDIPNCLSDIEDFAAAWDEFLQHRREIKKPVTQQAGNRILLSLSERPAESVEGLQTAVRRSWQGFEWSWMEREHRKNGTSTEPRGEFALPMNKPPERPV